MCESATYALSSDVVALATSVGMLVGTAESCTGGLVCAALTDIPGSSAVVRGGIVSYAVPVKESVLGVSSSITSDPAVGVVSSKCAESMARGACRVLGCDLSVSTTGIAGPSGAEPGKPVGTVWFGVCANGSTHSEVHMFNGDRASVRAQATHMAVALLKQELLRFVNK